MLARNTRSVYCTIFDVKHLSRALTLYQSLIDHNKTALFAFICIDKQSLNLLNKLNLDRALIFSDDDFLTPELELARNTRSRGEYCWTCKPLALKFLAKTIFHIDWFVYLDADTMIFSDPDSILSTENFHYVITPHRFSQDFHCFKDLVGDFNAGYFAVRASDMGIAVIDWWAEQCLNSCSVIPSDDTFADQKYLNAMPCKFPYGLSNPSISLNLGPWNVENYDIERIENNILVNDSTLVLYHFQGLRILNYRIIDLYASSRKLRKDVRYLIYRDYLTKLSQSIELLNQVDSSLAGIEVIQWPKKWNERFRLLIQFILGRRNFVWGMQPFFLSKK